MVLLMRSSVKRPKANASPPMLSRRFISAFTLAGQFFVAASVLAGAESTSEVRIATDALRLVWAQTPAGLKLTEAVIRDGTRELPIGDASGEYTLLYSADKPDTASPPTPWAGGT